MRYVLANWKMYPTVNEALELLDAIQTGLRERVDDAGGLPRVIVCPPFVSLVPLRALADGRLVRLGAQNCHWALTGPHTGEISPKMLKGLVDYVLVGHSERRAAGETDEQVARKVAAVAESGLIPVLFVGEDDRGDDGIALTEHRLRQGLSRIDLRSHPFLVVYEPSWAIGAEKAAPADHVGRAVEHLKAVLAGLGASTPEVVYGGTVAEDNIDELARLDVLDGVGATRGSLDAERFLQIIDQVTLRPRRQ